MEEKVIDVFLTFTRDSEGLFDIAKRELEYINNTVVTAFNALSIIPGDLVKLVTVICSLVTSFSTSYLALTRCREKWKIYRDAIESIKRLLVLGN